MQREITYVKCDVEKEEDILEVFKWAEKHLGGVDVLINNAGVLSLTSLSEESTDKFHQIINVNIIAPAIFSREFIQSVKKTQIVPSLIIARHIAEMMPVSLSIYPASKYAVRDMAASLRGDLARKKLDIKVTNISPGAIKTDMIGEFADKINSILEDKDIANTIIYILSMPPHVQIWDIIIMQFHNVNEEPLSS